MSKITKKSALLARLFFCISLIFKHVCKRIAIGIDFNLDMCKVYTATSNAHCDATMFIFFNLEWNKSQCNDLISGRDLLTKHCEE